MKRLFLFVGPCLAGSDLDALCAPIRADVQVLPPIQQGDLLRLSLDPSCVVGIIDGNFFQVPAVTHKEILLTLERGVRVLGASSLGALRAAELDVFGMEGVGEIYRMYKRGAIDGDDEVALVHGDAADGYIGVSEPLVNVRYNVRRARSAGLISSSTAALVVRRAKEMDFTRRTYASVLHAAGGSADPVELDALAGLFRERAVDLKRADALALLGVLARRFSGADAWPVVQPVAAHRTVYAHLFEREYVGQSSDGRHVSDAFVLSVYKLLSVAAPRTRRRATLRCLAVDEAQHRGLSAAHTDALVARFRVRKRLRSDAAFARWLDGHCLRLEELEAYLVEEDLERQVLVQTSRRQLVAEVAARTGMPKALLTRTPRMQPGIPWDGPLLREAKLSGTFRPMLELARQILDFADQTSAQLPGLAESLAGIRLEAWFAQKWGIRQTALRRNLLARGFTSYREFIDVARSAYVFEWLNPDSKPQPPEFSLDSDRSRSRHQALWVARQRAS
jgi:hypothetical protein